MSLVPQLLISLLAWGVVGDPMPMGRHLLMGLFTMLLIGLILISFVGYARFVGRRPVGEYGLGLSRSWWLDSLPLCSWLPSTSE